MLVLPVTQPWNIAFLIGMFIYVGIRHVFSERVKGQDTTVQHVDGLEKALLGIVTIGSLVLPALYLFSPWLSFANYQLPAAVPWVGAGAMVVALWLFWRSHADLGKQWSVSLEVRADHQLITGGVYRRVRHPMYSAIFLFSIAQGLMLQNWLAGWGALVTFVPLYLLRTPREERMMTAQFGDEYKAYMAKTGRILPLAGLHGE